MVHKTVMPKLTVIVLGALVLGGCATYYPSAHDAGVYHEPQRHARSTVMMADPLLYPYWSLDYFYYSRHYHPYSVLVHRHDPWYYPYPGWYHGYGQRGLYGSVHYPWYRYRGHYGGYQPWRAGAAFGFAERHRHPDSNRVRQIDERLGVLQTARSLERRSQRPDRLRLPTGSRRTPTSAIGMPIRSNARPGERPRRGPTPLERQRVIERRGGNSPYSATRRGPDSGPRRSPSPPSARGSKPVRSPRRAGGDTGASRSRGDRRER